MIVNIIWLIATCLHTKKIKNKSSNLIEAVRDREQLMEYHIAKLQYFYNKLEYLKKGLYPEFGGNIEFELYTFFEVCYHLKDWIKNSNNYNQFTNVEDYITNSEYLRICADICNRLKHKQLRDRRSNTPIGH